MSNMYKKRGCIVCGIDDALTEIDGDVLALPLCQWCVQTTTQSQDHEKDLLVFSEKSLV